MNKSERKKFAAEMLIALAPAMFKAEREIFNKCTRLPSHAFNSEYQCSVQLMWEDVNEQILRATEMVMEWE